MNQFFDQRGQVVHGNQNNVVNFGSVQTKQDFAAQLETLRNEVAESVENGVLDQNTAIGVESHLEKGRITKLGRSKISD
jgi:hypothetical protein